MGNRLHYHKKHEIEYGPEEGFNHQQENIYDLLSHYECQVFAENVEDSCYASSFSVPREDIEYMLKCLKKRKKDAVVFKDKWGKDVIEWTVQEAIDFFQAAYDNSPSDHSDIYFDWF